jgi:hypothetical protein
MYKLAEYYGEARSTRMCTFNIRRITLDHAGTCTPVEQPIPTQIDSKKNLVEGAAKKPEAAKRKAAPKKQKAAKKKASPKKK